MDMVGSIKLWIGSLSLRERCHGYDREGFENPTTM
jgi:hypothetical protein